MQIYEFREEVMKQVGERAPEIESVDRLLLDGMYERGMDVAQAVEEITTHYLNTDWVSKAFNFVEDIDWEGEAGRRGVELWPHASIGYCPVWELNVYAARLTNGGALVWEDGEFRVETAEKFADRQLTHGAIVFP